MDDKDVEIIVEQWQTCVEMANTVSQRRDTVNNLFVTINLAILVAVSWKHDLKSIYMLAAGFFLCILWITIIRNYKMLNKAKYSIILQLEELLPFSPFKMEWEEIKTLKKYKESTLLEFSLPILFMVLFILALIVIL